MLRNHIGLALSLLVGCADRPLAIPFQPDAGAANPPTDLLAPPADLSVPDDLAGPPDLSVPPDLAMCAPGGWSWQNPLPEGDVIRAVWGGGANDVWAAGAGVVRHFDGGAWSVLLNDGQLDLRSIWSAGGEAWAAGLRADTAADGSVTDHGVILHWDGVHWTTQVDLPREVFLGIRGAAANDLYAVGGQGGMVHWDGSSWSSFDGQVGGADGGAQNLRALWEFSPTDLWVFTLVSARHFNGVAWTSFPIEGNALANGAWGASSADLWLSTTTALMHWDGSAWSVAASPPNNAALKMTGGVWGSANDLWAATRFHGGLYHWNGSSWSVTRADTPVDIVGIWGRSDNDLWAVGGGGVALHWNGSQWKDTTSGFAPQLLEGVWASADDDVWAVGQTFSGGGQVLHFDGKSWSDATPPMAAQLQFTTVWGSGPRDVWAVAWSSSNQAQLYHWDGASWSLSTAKPPSTVAPVAAWGADSGDVWVTGYSGALHWNGAMWSAVPMPAGNYFGVWGTARNDVWAAGSAVTAHWDGAQWSAVNGAPTGDKVWGSGSDDVWIADSQSLSHWNGAGWTSASVPLTPSVHGVAGWSRTKNDAWMVGLGATAHWNGAAWSLVPSGAEQALTAIFALGCSAWAVGADGAVLHLQ